MRQGQIVEITLKNKVREVGFYQYTEGGIVLSIDSAGMTSWKTDKKDILKIKEL